MQSVRSQRQNTSPAQTENWETCADRCKANKKVCHLGRHTIPPIAGWMDDTDCSLYDTPVYKARQGRHDQNSPVDLWMMQQQRCKSKFVTLHVTKTVFS